MSNKKGFTMVELLVVLVIVGILAAVAVPLYVQHTKRAKMSEAIATMSLIRQAMRDYQVNHSNYFDIPQLNTTGNIQKPLPTSISDAAAGTPSPNPSGIEVDAGTAKYFSNSAFSLETGTGLDTDGASGKFTTPNTVNFLITADGSKSYACPDATTTNCATQSTEVTNYRAEMDNSGRIFVSFDAGTTWSTY